MTYIILALRALMIVICLETAIRYWIWWRTAKRENAGLLTTLLIGIALAQSGIAIRHLDIFYYASPHPMLWLVLIADIFMLIGTLFHLVPAWQISYAYDDRKVRRAICVRMWLAATIAVAVLAYDFSWIEL